MATYTAKDLLARLKRHYIKPGPLPGGVFLPEVTHNDPGSRRVDALYVGFAKSRGLHMLGHEIKVSRSDWLHELDQSDKAETWATQCHGWYVVAPPSIVRHEELPHGWGLMVPGTSKTRMTIEVKADLHPEVEPSWATTHSVLKRMDTLTWERERHARDVGLQVAQETITRLTTEGLEARAQVRAMGDAQRLQSLVDQMTEILGLQVTEGRAWADGDVSLHQLRTSFGPWLAADKNLTALVDDRLWSLQSTQDRLDGAAEAVRAVVKALEQLPPGR